MGTFGIYLLKSAIWLTGFAIVYLAFLRNERYFRLNRIFLFSGIIASITFPFYTWYYTVLIPSEYTSSSPILDLPAHSIAQPSHETHLFWWLYTLGIGLLVVRLIWQTINIIRKLYKAEYEVKGTVKIVRTNDYVASFSFFSYIFVNPSMSDIETNEIVNHESEHIKQKHWFDLLLAEFLCILQWFNPIVWIYAHLIRQNHEYLADERALQYSSNPAHYQAALLNQLIGAPVIRLANSFNYSLDKKRFKMMKKIVHSPFRKLKLLLILPLLALVFYAFAEPNYKAFTTSVILNEEASLENDQIDKNVSYMIEPTVTDTVKHSSINENKKNFRNHTLLEVDTVQSTPERDHKKSYPINITAKDSAILNNAKNLNIKIGYPPSELHLKKTRTSDSLISYAIVNPYPLIPKPLWAKIGQPNNHIVFPNNKQIKFAFRNKDLTLIHDKFGNSVKIGEGKEWVQMNDGVRITTVGMKSNFPGSVQGHYSSDSIVNKP